MKRQLFSIIIVLAMLISAIEVPVLASDNLLLTVSSETAQAGETVDVTVSVSNNTGLASLKFDIAYDSALKLVGVTFNSAFGSMITAPEPFRNPEPLTMISPLEDITANGVLATLTFAVSKKVSNGYKADIKITFQDDDIYDSNFDNVSTSVINGCVEVVDGEKFLYAIKSSSTSIRRSTKNSPEGLRFSTTVSKSAIGINGDYYYDVARCVFGMMLLPKDILEQSGYGTIRDFFESGDENNILNVVAKNIYSQDSDTLTYTAVLINIPEDELSTTICAVPYMLKNGKYYFGAQIEDSYSNTAKRLND